jgi:hypothetical protein
LGYTFIEIFLPLLIFLMSLFSLNAKECEASVLPYVEFQRFFVLLVLPVLLSRVAHGTDSNRSTK